MEDNKNILGIMSSAIREYLNLRTDDLRKNIIESLSVGFSRVLAVLVIILLLLIVLAIFAFAFIVLLGQAIGSMSGAAFIIGGLYMTGVVILFFLRKRLFLDMFTNLFTGIVGSDNPADNWKTLLLMVVKNLRNSLNAS